MDRGPGVHRLEGLAGGPLLVEASLVQEAELPEVRGRTLWANRFFLKV